MPPRQPPLALDRIADALERIAKALEAPVPTRASLDPLETQRRRNEPHQAYQDAALQVHLGSMLNPVTEAVHCKVCGLFAAVAEKTCNRRDCPSQDLTP
jgi:hypothetical protein